MKIIVGLDMDSDIVFSIQIQSYILILAEIMIYFKLSTWKWFLVCWTSTKILMCILNLLTTLTFKFFFSSSFFLESLFSYFALNVTICNNWEKTDFNTGFCYRTPLVAASGISTFVISHKFNQKSYSLGKMIYWLITKSNLVNRQNLKVW